MESGCCGEHNKFFSIRRNLIMRIILSLVALCLLAGNVSAGEIYIRKPDGTIVPLKVWAAQQQPQTTVKVKVKTTINVTQTVLVPVAEVIPVQAPAPVQMATACDNCRNEINLANPPEYWIDGCERFVALGIYAQVPCCGGNGEVRHVLLCDVRNGQPVGRLVIPPNAVHVGWYVRVQRVRGVLVTPWHYYLN